MENKKTVEEIRSEIKSLEEQEFELKYGLTKEGYSKIKDDFKREIILERFQSITNDSLSNSYSRRMSSQKIDDATLQIDFLKSRVNDLEKINMYQVVAMVVLGIGVILNAIF